MLDVTCFLVAVNESLFEKTIISSAMLLRLALFAFSQSHSKSPRVAFSSNGVPLLATKQSDLPQKKKKKKKIFLGSVPERKSRNYIRETRIGHPERSVLVV